MNDNEFDVLDALYFVQTFQALQEETELEEEVLKNTLLALIKKSWVKCFARQNSEEIVSQQRLYFEENYKVYAYLATKEGLLAHNS